MTGHSHGYEPLLPATPDDWSKIYLNSYMAVRRAHYGEGGEGILRGVPLDTHPRNWRAGFEWLSFVNQGEAGRKEGEQATREDPVFTF